MIDFSSVRAITIPEGKVSRILSGATVLWQNTRENLASLAKVGVLNYTANTTHSRDGLKWHIDKKDAHSGLYFIPDELTVGETYTFSYKFQKDTGTLVKVGGHHAAFTQVKWYLDGMEQTTGYSSAVSVDDDNEVHEVSFTCVYAGGSGDINLYFQPNRGSATPITCYIWDVKLEKGNTATAWSPAPEDIQEVPYIESDGNQYIDTGYAPNQNTGFDVDFIFYSTFDKTGFGSLFGARKNAQDKELLISSYGGYYAGGLFRYGTKNYDPGMESGTRISATLRNGVYSNSLGTEITLNAETFESPVNLVLFACNHNGSITEKGKVRLYSLKFYDGDTVIRDFVPCQNSLGDFYLYDRANKKAYENAGTGAFSGVSFVDYIESDGNQYIDTGVAINSGAVEYDFKYALANTTQHDKYVTGFKAGNLVASFGIYSGTIYTSYGQDNATYHATIPADTEPHTIKVNTSGTYVDGVYTKPTNYGLSVDSATGNHFIFQRYHGTTLQRGAFRVYYFKMYYTDGTLIRDYVPCINASGAYGLYDKVNGQFYGNVGSGTITGA